MIWGFNFGQVVLWKKLQKISKKGRFKEWKGMRGLKKPKKIEMNE